MNDECIMLTKYKKGDHYERINPLEQTQTRNDENIKSPLENKGVIYESIVHGHRLLS